ncbi:KilA-N domain-containing protein [Gordonibacter sp.]|uniref:KilA-N domain-containing protein n=2 Tax=Gordonibacter sp. TaxID=1968902 RepID=UPI002FC79BCE
MIPKEYREKLDINGLSVEVITEGTRDDFISLTDIARYKSDNEKMVIQNWMRNRNTLEFLGVWEEINNPDFKGIEFDAFRHEAGLNSFVMTPTKWITNTNAKGIRVKRGRYGGTYAHIDIAFEFASWISPEFKLFIIKDYQRLKNDETNRLSLEWNEKRLFSKINYRIHTDAIQQNIIPGRMTKQRAGYVYANEADMLNAALFGMTAKEWRESNPDKPGNVRDYATLHQLIVLANMESMNAELILAGKSMSERALYLNAMAIRQLDALARGENAGLKRLEDDDGE